MASEFQQQTLVYVEDNPANQRLMEDIIDDVDGLALRTAPSAEMGLEQLHAAGIAVAVDDFGTGHSSLAYLKTPPLSTLKIDRAFVMDLEDSLVDRQLARTITQLAHGVGCNVVAEGIETQAQADALCALGCHLGQGFLFAKPGPLPASSA